MTALPHGYRWGDKDDAKVITMVDALIQSYPDALKGTAYEELSNYLKMDCSK